MLFHNKSILCQLISGRDTQQKVSNELLLVDVSTTEISHEENEYVDFLTQPLLPRMYSTQGPAIAMVDVNGDGLNDLFIGGAKSFTSALYLKNKEGIYNKSELSFDDASSEDVDATFFDADGDGDQDLYVVSGGYEFSSGDRSLQDRLYMNSGDGNFEKAENNLPMALSSGSCVRPYDYDGDSDIDLFVGGRVTPGSYPLTPQSYILENDGNGSFNEVTSNVSAELNPELSLEI